MSIFETAKNGYLPKGLTHGFGKKIHNFLLERKEAFEDDENVNFLNSKKWVFAKGVTPWFWSKNSQFFLVCFSAK